MIFYFNSFFLTSKLAMTIFLFACIINLSHECGSSLNFFFFLILFVSNNRSDFL